MKMKSIARIDVESKLYFSYGFSTAPTTDGQLHKSTMELFKDEEEEFRYGIEWDMPSIDESVYMVIFTDLNESCTEQVIDYDGVYVLPEEALKLLEQAGLNTLSIREDMNFNNIIESL